MSTNSISINAILTIIAISILSLTGCKDQSTRFEWSQEKNCLADHYENMCYESPGKMEAIGFSPDRAERVWKKAKRKHAKKQMMTEARKRYSEVNKSN